MGTPSPKPFTTHQSKLKTSDRSEQGGFTLIGLGNIVSGVFTPVLAKHTKHLTLVDILSVGVDRMQRNFEPMRRQVEAWKGTRLPDDTAKLVIYQASKNTTSRRPSRFPTFAEPSGF